MASFEDRDEFGRPFEDDFEDFEKIAAEISRQMGDDIEQAWYDTYVTDDTPMCLYGMGDEEGLCINGICNCYYIGCEHATQ